MKSIITIVCLLALIIPLAMGKKEAEIINFEVKAADFGDDVVCVWLQIHNPLIKTVDHDFVVDITKFDKAQVDPYKFVQIDKTSNNFKIWSKEGKLLYFTSSVKVEQFYTEINATILTENKESQFTRLFGLGQRAGEFFLDSGIYTVQNKDGANPIEDGIPPGENIYGSHPVYMSRISSQFMLVFNNNPYAKDYIIQYQENGQIQITEKGIGGTLQLFFIFLQKPNVIVQKYHDLIGHSILPPF